MPEGLLRQVSLYLHTVRHLKAGQIYHKLLQPYRRPALRGRARPSLRAPSAAAKWFRAELIPPSMLGASRFRLIGEDGDLGSLDGWNSPKRSKLWLYNLHYFDDLNAEGAAGRREWHVRLMNRWIDENPVGHGNGWEPYPLSLRITNWIKWALSGHDLDERQLESLRDQADWLDQSLELHLLGNHLLANLKALIFAGTFFQGNDAEGWRRRAEAILLVQLDEQFLKDGGHFERSPMYQATLTADLLDLANLSRAFPQILDSRLTARIDKLAETALAWLAAMSHPDGGIGFFNDATHGIAASPERLEGYARGIGIALPKPLAADVLDLEPSGYVRLQRGPMVALLDLAPLGPDYLLGHGHADTLSFELSVGGERIIVNTGVSEYGTSPERLRQRGTAAHSTVEIDQQDSSEVWSGFRVARRARLVERKVGDGEITGAHDGYRRLSGRPLHRRRWCPGNRHLEVIDEIDGGFECAIVRFHLHPDILPDILPDFSGQKVLLRMRSGGYVALETNGGKPNIVDSSYHPGFGVSRPCSAIEVVLEGRRLVTRLDWSKASRGRGRGRGRGEADA